MLGTADDVVGRVAFAFEQQVGLANGVSLSVDFLAVQVRRHLLAVLRGELLKCLLGYRQHAARAARTVVEQVGAGLDLVGDRQQDQLRHQLHGVSRCPVLAGFFVGLFVEAADQLLEDGSHAMVVETVRAQIDIRESELLDQRSERVCLRETRNLVAELKVVEDVLHVG